MIIYKKIFLLVIIWLLRIQTAFCQHDSTNHRLRVINIGIPATYGLTMTGLYSLWYKGYPMSKFHFFNDNNEWMQVDKMGHSYSAYQLSRTGVELYRWSGLTGRKAILTGGVVGYSYLTTIEILDGFSSNWGASWGDLVANTIGTGLYVVQELFWKEQKINLKFSFSQSPYHQLRPNVLGENFPQQMFKDYNGQTYWLSANIKSLCLATENKFPAWLNLAVGYGAQGMIGSENNSFLAKGSSVAVNYSYIPRFRQWYLAPDIDFTRIPTKSKALKRVFFILNCVKLPFPTLEKNKNGLKFHYLYF